MLTSTNTIQPIHSNIERIALRGGDFAGMYVWPVGNQVGESPVWDTASDTLFWIDVRGQAVLRLDPARGALSRWALPQVVGALAIVRPQLLLLALKRQLALFDLDTGRLSLFAPIAEEPAGNRLNEGKLSPSGRWFLFGSMDDRPEHKQPTGSLYRADMAGHVLHLHHGLTTANGLAWSPDGRAIYFSDSFAGNIWQAVWNEDEGRMHTPRLFATSDEASGRPDGALVDAAGRYVSAGVSAGCMNVFGPDGKIVLRVPLPVHAPTMPSVGGVGGSRLFVTSLVRTTWKTPGQFDGHLLEVDSQILDT
jgi:sugar lactone lactonase YvrE